MFKHAQSIKGGCAWQLIGDEHCSAWLTIGTTIITPLPVDVGLVLLKAFRKCDEHVTPFQVSLWQATQIYLLKSQSPRRRVLNRDQIPPIDEDEEDH